jgi:hypothetical protein
VPTPANSAVADVGAPEVFDARAVVVDRIVGRKMNLCLGRPQLRVDQVEEALLHGSLERARPRKGRGPSLLVGVLIHVERVHVGQRQPLQVDHPGRELVLRHGADREHGYERAPLVPRSANPADEILGEGSVEVVGLLDDADPEVGVFVLRKLLARDPAHPLAGLPVAERDELCEVVFEVPPGCQRAPPSGK